MGDVLTDDAAKRVRCIRFDILRIRADVANMREREGDDLSGIGRICHHLLIAGHRGIEADFADSVSLGAKTAATQNCAVGKNQHARRCLGCAQGHGVGHAGSFLLVGRFGLKRLAIGGAAYGQSILLGFSPLDRLLAYGVLERMIRDEIKAAQVSAMKAGEKQRLAAVRLILSELKNRDIAARTGGAIPDDDSLCIAVLTKMAKQRRESIDMYVKGGREELAAQERGELAVIEGFMPAMMSDAEARSAVDAVVADLGAAGMKDMGCVMAEVKARHSGKIDMGSVSGIVKASLGG